MKLADLNYETNFYWKGDRYVQFMRPRNPPKTFSVLCYVKNDPCGPYFDMPSGRKVKPVIEVKHGRN